MCGEGVGKDVFSLESQCVISKVKTSKELTVIVFDMLEMGGRIGGMNDWFCSKF